jgi:hypothetical protein
MSLPRPYLALDPGTTGALALVAGREVIVVDIPYRRTVVDGRGRRVLDLEALADVCRMLAIFEPILVTEAVAGRRGDDAWSVGELTRSAGAVEAALAACGAGRLEAGAWAHAHSESPAQNPVPRNGSGIVADLGCVPPREGP